MKYKSLIISLLLVVGFVGAAYSAEPMFQTRWNDGEYAISHTTISITTGTHTTIPAKDGYRKITIQFQPTYAQECAGSSIAIALNGSTATIMSNSYIVQFGTETTRFQNKIYERTFETNGVIYLRGLANGGSTTVEGRYWQKEK